MNRNIFQATVAVFVLILFAFALDSARKWTSGVHRVDTIAASGVSTEVFDVKSGNRACLVFISKFDNIPQPQFFFACPNDR